MMIPRHTTTIRRPAMPSSAFVVMWQGQHGRRRLAALSAGNVGGLSERAFLPQNATPRPPVGRSVVRFLPVGVAAAMVQLHQVPSSRFRAFGDVQFPRAPKKKADKEGEEAYGLI